MCDLFLFFSSVLQRFGCIYSVLQYLTPEFGCTHSIYMLLGGYCDTFLRESRDLPFPFSVRLLAAFGSLSSLERARSTQGTAPE